MQRWRRTVLLGGAAMAGMAVLPPRGLAAVPTPRATEGPFYPAPAMRHADDDADLVRLEGAVRAAGGEVVFLSGRVLDRGGRPVPGARVEIWQCDANGRYLHPGDRGGAPRDDAFQGFGHVVTGSEGRYRFRTIRPVAYPGRTPHIHVKVQAGGRALTTQFYLDGDPRNAADVLWRRMSAAEARAVAMTFGDRGTTAPEAVVDIRL